MGNHSLNVPAAGRWMCFSELFHPALDSYSGRLVWDSHWNRGWEDITVYWLKPLLFRGTVNLKGMQTDGYFCWANASLRYSWFSHDSHQSSPQLWRWGEKQHFLLLYCITVSFKCATLNIFTLCHAWQWYTIRWHREEVLKNVDNQAPHCWTFSNVHWTEKSLTLIQLGQVL